MEISPVFGKPIILTRLSPITSSFTPSPPLRTKNPQPTSSATTTITTIITPPPPPLNVSTKSSKRNSVSHKARQSAMVEIQQSPDLDSALARLGGVLKTQDLNVVLRHFGKLNRLKELSQVFEWMKQNEKISAFSYSSYIKLMGKSLSPIKALEIYKNIKDESTRNHVSVCNSVISCLIRNGKFESSISLFRQMKKDGLVPDIVTYSTLLAGCAKVRNGYSKALELVDELMQNGLKMDHVLYGTILCVCASNNQLKDAETYFKQMKDEGHTPNVFHYSSLLNAYAIDGDYKKAESVLQEMKSLGLVPNKVILTTLLKVYVRGGLFEKSRELLNELQALGYAEDEMAYCLLMDGLAKTGHINDAKAVFEEMKAKNVRTDGYAHSIMISAFCRCGSLDEAKQLAIEFEAKYDKYDVVILNTMLCAYCRAGEMENVMKMMKKMDQLAIAPDWNTFHILIKYFCKEKMYLLAYRTLADMHSKGHQPAEELCSALISHLGRAGAHSEAFCVYNMLRYSKRTMSKAHHEKILHILIRGRHLKDAYVIVKDNAGYISKSAIKKFAFSFMKAGNVNLINDVMKALHSSGYKIDQGVFEMAVLRYIAEPEKKELLLKLLQWMPGQGYAVDSSTRNLLLKNSHLFGRQLIAEILSEQRFFSKSSSTMQK